MRSPPSTFENRTYGAEKIGSGHNQSFATQSGASQGSAALPPKAAATATDWRVGLANKLNLCCASHPMISEPGDPCARARYGSKRETGNAIASHQALDRYRRS